MALRRSSGVEILAAWEVNARSATPGATTRWLWLITRQWAQRGELRRSCRRTPSLDRDVIPSDFPLERDGVSW